MLPRVYWFPETADRRPKARNCRGIHPYSKAVTHGSSPRGFTLQLLRRAMKGARLVVVQSKQGEFLPAILCDSIRTAAFVSAAYRGVGACCICRKLFAIDPLREEKPYCPKCAQPFWQRQYRNREKQKQAIRTKSTKHRKENK